jgi:hypothetical protein
VISVIFRRTYYQLSLDALLFCRRYPQPKEEVGKEYHQGAKAEQIEVRYYLAASGRPQNE